MHAIAWVVATASAGIVDLFWKIGNVWGLGCNIWHRGETTRCIPAVLWRCHTNANNFRPGRDQIGVGSWVPSGSRVVQ